MSGDRPTLEELKATWKRRVQEAERQLEGARDEVRRLGEELKAGSIPSPDLHYAYQNALRAEALALEKYANVLTIFNDLVLQGTIPEQGPEAG